MHVHVCLQECALLRELGSGGDLSPYGPIATRDGESIGPDGPVHAAVAIARPTLLRMIGSTGPSCTPQPRARHGPAKESAAAGARAQACMPRAGCTTVITHKLDQAEPQATKAAQRRPPPQPLLAVDMVDDPPVNARKASPFFTS